MMIRPTLAAKECGVCKILSLKFKNMDTKSMGSGGMNRTFAEKVPKKLLLKPTDFPFDAANYKKNIKCFKTMQTRRLLK